MFQAGHDYINAWARSNFGPEAARVEAAILRIECEYPQIDASEVRKAVEADPEVYVEDIY